MKAGNETSIAKTKTKKETLPAVVAKNATVQTEPQIDITVDEGGKIMNSNFSELIGTQLNPEAVANIPDGTLIDSPDPLDATARLFEPTLHAIGQSVNLIEKPKRKRETAAERIARLAAAADAAEKARNEKK